MIGGNKKFSNDQGHSRFAFVWCSHNSLFLFKATERRTSGHKRHHCMYCGKDDYKLPRHLENNHKSEDLVKKVLALPKGSKERRDGWNKIASEGDFKINVRNMKENRGIIVVARNKSKASVEEFVPCTFCHKFFHERTLFRHSNACSFKLAEDAERPQHLKSSRTMLSIHLNDDNYKEIRSLLAKMKKCDLHIIIRNDQSLLLYGTVQLQKKEKERYSDVRYSLRCLANLLKQYRTYPGNESASAKDLVSSMNYENVLKATKQLSGYKGPRDIEKPLFFMKCGYCLLNLSQYLKCAALKLMDKDRVEDLRNFTELYGTDWLIYANNARATHEMQKANKPQQLPLESDVKKFRDALIRNIETLMEKIQNSKQPKAKHLRSLADNILARLLTFNARRGCECSKLSLQNWIAVEVYTDALYFHSII